MSRNYQIHEEDLQELEMTLPLLMLAHPTLTTSREKTMWRRVQKIIQDVRWNYGPWEQCFSLPNDDAPPDEPESV